MFPQVFTVSAIAAIILVIILEKADEKYAVTFILAFVILVPILTIVAIHMTTSW